MKPLNPDYPAMVKEVRRQLALSQEDLARELGVSYATVNRWENEQSKPSKLARAQLDMFCEKMEKRGLLALPRNDNKRNI
jgi:putative transcriptional regulator